MVAVVLIALVMQEISHELCLVKLLPALLVQLIPNTAANHTSNTTVTLPLSAGKIMIVLSFFRFLNVFYSDGVILDGGGTSLF